MRLPAFLPADAFYFAFRRGVLRIGKTLRKTLVRTLEPGNYNAVRHSLHPSDIFPAYNSPNPGILPKIRISIDAALQAC